VVKTLVFNIYKKLWLLAATLKRSHIVSVILHGVAPPACTDTHHDDPVRNPMRDVECKMLGSGDSRGMEMGAFIKWAENIYSFASSFTVPTLSLAPYFFSTPSLWY